MWIQKRSYVCIKNVPVCTGITPACGNTCERGACPHGDVLNAHTKGVLSVHTGRGEGGGGQRDTPTPTHTHTPHTSHTPHTHHTHTSHTHHTHLTHTTKHTTQNTQGVIASSAYQNLPTWGYHLTPEVHQRNPWILHVLRLRIGGEIHQSFTLPDEAVKLQLSGGNRWREPAVRWFRFVLRTLLQVYRTICTSVSILQQGFS